jgi:hypothetical protein
VERGDTLRSRAAWASSRPARVGLRGARCTGAGEGPPVCIRWFQEARPEPSRGLKNLGCRGGAPKGERARSMRSRRPRSSQREGKEKGRAPHRFSMRPGGAPLGAPPPFLLREAFLATLLGLAFLGVDKARVRSRIATTKRLFIAGHSRSKNGVALPAYDPAIHGASQNTRLSKLHSAIQHRPPGQARW